MILARDRPISWNIDIAVDADARVHAAWSDSEIRTVMAGPDGEWRSIDNPFVADDSHHVELVGNREGPPALLVHPSYGHENSAVWRFSEGGWIRAWDGLGDHGATQGREPIAMTADGTVLFFSEVSEEDGSSEGVLLELAVGDTTPVRLPLYSEGGDPLVAVDAADDRHIVFAGLDTSAHSLSYLGPDGTQTELLADHTGWPDFAAADDGLFVVADTDTGPVLVAGDGAGRWRTHPVGDPIDEGCDGTLTHTAADVERVGETCDHLARYYPRYSVSEGPWALVVVEEVHERGQQTWRCPEGHGAQCGWQRDDGFDERHRLLLGRATMEGVELTEVPFELGAGFHYTWGYEATLDATGQPHLLVNAATAHDRSELHYLGLSCREGGISGG